MLVRSFVGTLAVLALATTARAQDVERRPAGPLGKRADADSAPARKAAPVKPPASQAIVTPAPTPTPSTPPAPAAAAPDPRAATIGAAFAAGRKINPRVSPVDSAGWQRVAATTSLGYDDLVAAWDAIYVVDFAYRYLVAHPAIVMPPGGGAPGVPPEMLEGMLKKNAPRLIDRLRRGESWEHVWRDVATSPDREAATKLVGGVWAPAPLASGDEARPRFGLRTTPAPTTCLGALGSDCDDPAPATGAPRVQWTDQFTLPDGTKMGFAAAPVDVGSILYADLCVGDPHAPSCAGYEQLADFAKTAAKDDLTGLELAGWAAGLEKGSGSDAELQARASAFTKAVWEVRGKSWRATFGPYPVDAQARHSHWYDDLRPATAREAWMAPVMKDGTTTTDQTMRYLFDETRATLAIRAPNGMSLDAHDAAFCLAPHATTAREPRDQHTTIVCGGNQK